jgi:hypothetical protein
MRPWRGCSPAAASAADHRLRASNRRRAGLPPTRDTLHDPWLAVRRSVPGGDRCRAARHCLRLPWTAAVVSVAVAIQVDDAIAGRRVGIGRWRHRDAVYGLRNNNVTLGGLRIVNAVCVVVKAPRNPDRSAVSGKCRYGNPDRGRHDHQTLYRFSIRSPRMGLRGLVHGHWTRRVNACVVTGTATRRWRAPDPHHGDTHR